MHTLQVIVFWLLLVDSLVANIVAWFGGAWYANNLRTFSRFFPLTKAWAGLYLVLVLWIGYITLA